MKVVLLSICCSFLLMATALGQGAQHHWGLGLAPGLYSYNTNLFSGQDYGGGVELSFYKYLFHTMDLGLETGFARVRHPLNPNTQEVNQRDNFFTTSLLLKVKFANGKILKQDFPIAPFLKFGGGANTYSNFSNWAFYLPAGAGVTLQIPKFPINFTVQTAFNYGLDNNHFWHHSFGVGINFGKRKNKKKNTPVIDITKASDRDYDTVPDDEDRCPDIFGDPATNGCPDSDGDNVPDSEDKCANTKGYANLMGCLDSDYDGIIDPEDKCPNMYGEDLTGCPEDSALDIDGDGVPNDRDACPDVKGLFTADGCPDKDGDGIADNDDTCPDYYGVAQHGGCPLDPAEMDRMKDLVENTPSYPDEQVITKYGYVVNPDGTVEGIGGQKLLLRKDGRLINEDDGSVISPNNKFTFDPAYNLVVWGDKDNVIRMNELGEMKDGGDILIANLGGNGDPYNPNNNIGDPNDPYDPNNPMRGNGNSGNGGIQIGNPTSGLYGDLAGTGFPSRPNLTPEEEEYCQRIDISALRAAIYFEYDDATLNSESYRHLNRVVEAMRKCATLEIQVAGHADSDGSADYNMGLSEKRAKSVLRYITGEGINDKRMKYNSYGEDYPLVPNDSDGNKGKNRRAEIRVTRSLN